MKRLRRMSGGFSLVELIIVIAIMAALVGILAPQYLKYVAKSRAVACLSSRDNAAQAYMVEKIDQGSATEQDVMDSVMASMGAKKTTSGGVTGYTGICPEGGIVTFEVAADGSLELFCSKHEDSVSPSLAYKMMSSMTGFWNKLTRSNKSLFTYLKEGTDSSPKYIDSNYRATNSWVASIKNELQGINYDSQTWCLSSNSSTITFKITTDGAVGGGDVGSTVNVLVYTYDKSGNLISGPTAGTSKVDTYKPSGGTPYTVLSENGRKLSG